MEPNYHAWPLQEALEDLRAQWPGWQAQVVQTRPVTKRQAPDMGQWRVVRCALQGPQVLELTVAREQLSP